MNGSSSERKDLDDQAVSIFPLQDSSSFLYRQLGRVYELVREWRTGAPEIFTGEGYRGYRAWLERTCVRGYEALGYAPELARRYGTSAFGTPSSDLALILTQEGNPYHGLPISFALSTALSISIAAGLDENVVSRDLDRDSIDSQVRRSKLVAWFLENPQEFSPPS